MTPQPEPIVAPESAAAVKWSGAITTIAALVLIFVLFDWAAGLLALVGCFGTLMVCIGAEAEG